MKARKKVVAMAIAAIAVITGYEVYTSQDNINLSDLTLDNIEALASAREVITSNTGPGKIVKCTGNAGHRKLCMCEYPNTPCTESPCQ